MKNKFKWKNLVRIVLLLVCGVILGVNVYMANARNLVGNQLPMPFGFGAAVVLSGSMEPTLSVNDLIIVKEQEQYAVEDIVVYQSNSLIVHRIVDMNDTQVITKGDANNVQDSAITKDAIKGKVVCVIPFVGSMINLLKTPLGIVIIIAAAIALVEIPRRREKAKDDEEKQKIIDEIRRLKDEL